MKRKFILPVCVLIALNLGFIWGNSMLSASQSAGLSGGLHLWIGDNLPFLAGVGEKLLRKLMHAWEFAALGFLLTALWRLLGLRTLRGLPLTLLSGMSAGLIDETIQLSVPNRGPSITDVWIDFGGILAGIVLFLLAHLILKRTILKGNTQNEKVD